MKIEIDIEIGDPVLKIDNNQHDGWVIMPKRFSWNDIPNIGKTVFKTSAETEAALREMTKKGNSR